LEDWVPADHPARFLREFVDALDVEALGFSSRSSEDGRPNYASDLLLKVWLFGYVNGIRSLRKLERACRENVGLLWLTGLNAPDHNTLWRFWRDNRQALRGVFKLVVRTAVEAKLVGVVLHAIDGTKVLSQGSKERVRKREEIEAALARLDDVVDEVMGQIEAAARAEDETEGYRLPAQWREQMLRREQLRELVAECEINDRQTIHELEREARFMKTRREGTALAYNAQSVVDADSGLIVAAEVSAEGNDNHVLVAMLDQVTDTVGQAAEETVADAGYYSGEQLHQAEQRGYGVLVNERRDDAPPEDKTAQAYDSTRFRYDQERDCCVCPLGKDLPFEGIKSMGLGKGGEQVRRYRCKQFAACPVRSQCSQDPKGRTVSIGRFHGPITRQREKTQVADKHRLLRQRKVIVEPPFGLIKEIMQFRRFTVVGLEKVRVQWSLICSAFNLRKLYPHWRAGRLRFA
jgi:transposase